DGHTSVSRSGKRCIRTRRRVCGESRHGYGRSNCRTDSEDFPALSHRLAPPDRANDSTGRVHI
ncbi:MAG: hypothetical protein ACREQI_17100, partial [Candidatus Binataceae bacterium]